MKRLLRIFLLAAALLAVLCVSTMAADEPDVAGLYGFTGDVTVTPYTAESELPITESNKGDAYSAFYEDAVRFDVTYRNDAIEAGEQYLLLVCSGEGAPSESNIVYINQAASDVGKVEFTGTDRAYPSSLGRGEYRIYVVGENSAYDLDNPTATFKSHLPYKLGDVNEDGKVATSDALIILRAAAQLEELTDMQRLAADVNGDGVDATDALAIMQFVVGIDNPHELSND